MANSGRFAPRWRPPIAARLAAAERQGRRAGGLGPMNTVVISPTDAEQAEAVGRRRCATTLAARNPVRAADVYAGSGAVTAKCEGAVVGLHALAGSRRRARLAARRPSGSARWRAVNERLLGDTRQVGIRCDAAAGKRRRPSVARWVEFFEAPSATSWYRAHNASIVAGYRAPGARSGRTARRAVRHERRAPARPDAQALVSDGGLALVRLSFLSPLIGHPRARMAGTFLAIANVVPAEYPIETPTVEALIGLENPLGRLLDYGVIGPRVDALYASAANALDEPRLLGLVRNGAPVYAWPYERRQVWRKPRAHYLTSLAGGAYPAPDLKGDDVT